MSMLPFQRESGNYTLFAQWPLPGSAPADDNDVSAVVADIYDAADLANPIATGVSMSYDAAVLGWTASRPVTDLAGVRVLLVVYKPTSSNSNIQNVTGRAAVADILKRQDEIETKVDALQTDFDAFETVNQSEHDSTQSKIDTIGAASESTLSIVQELTIPDSGSNTYTLEFRLKDLDASPVQLIDPDNNRVTVTVKDQSGSTSPTGITLSDSDGVTAGSQMTRDAAGKYSTVVTVASTANELDQLRFEADYEVSGVTNSSPVATAKLLKIAPTLARIESNTNTLITRVGQDGDTSAAATLFGRHKLTEENVDALNDISSGTVQSIVDAAESDIRGDIAALNDLSSATVQSIVDAAETNIRGADNDTLKTLSDHWDASQMAELSAGAPPDNPTPVEALMWGYMQSVNKYEFTEPGGNEKRIHNAAGQVIAKKIFASSAGVYTEDKSVAP